MNEKEQFLVNLREIRRRFAPILLYSSLSEAPKDYVLPNFDARAKKGASSYKIILTGSPWTNKNSVILAVKTILEAHFLDENKNYRINTTPGLLGGTTQIIIWGVSGKFLKIVKDISEVLIKRAYFVEPIILRVK